MSESIYNIALEVCEDLNFELWGIEYPKSNGGKLRIFIESLDSATSIGIDDCVAVSERLSLLLDTLDEFNFKYHLEVSSPGLNRIIFSNKQYKRYLHKNFKLKLKSPIENSNIVVGTLQEVLEDGIVLNIKGNIYKISYDEIKKATVNLLEGD